MKSARPRVSPKPRHEHCGLVRVRSLLARSRGLSDVDLNSRCIIDGWVTWVEGNEEEEEEEKEEGAKFSATAKMACRNVILSPDGLCTVVKDSLKEDGSLEID